MPLREANSKQHLGICCLVAVQGDGLPRKPSGRDLQVRVGGQQGTQPLPLRGPCCLCMRPEGSTCTCHFYSVTFCRCQGTNTVNQGRRRVCRTQLRVTDGLVTVTSTGVLIPTLSHSNLDGIDPHCHSGSVLASFPLLLPLFWGSPPTYTTFAQIFVSRPASGKILRPLPFPGGETEARRH